MCALSGGRGREERGCPLLPTSLILSTVHELPLVLIRCPRINSILILNLIKNRFPLIHLPSGSELGIRLWSAASAWLRLRPSSRISVCFHTSLLSAVLAPQPLVLLHTLDAANTSHFLPLGRAYKQLLPPLKFLLLWIIQTWESRRGYEDDQLSRSPMRQEPWGQGGWVKICSAKCRLTSCQGRKHFCHFLANSLSL